MADGHLYTLAATGMTFDTKTFCNRFTACNTMYDIITKNKLQLLEVWEDHHDITYVCSNNVKFYINRC